MISMKLKQKNISFFSRYSIFILALLISLNQLRLRKEGLNSWKGGGFGMYAEIHPIFRKVFIKANNSSEQIDQKKVLSNKSKDIMHDKILIYPKDDYLQKIKSDYIENTKLNHVQVEVWVPVFDPNELTFELKLLKAIH